MANIFTRRSQLYLIDDYSKQLKTYEMLGITERYTIDSSEIVNIVEDFYEELQERYELICDEGVEALSEKPLLLMMVANNEAIQVLGKNATVLRKYKDIVGKYAGLKVCIVYTNIENSAIGFNAPDILKQFKDSRNLYFFDDLKNLKLYDVGNNALRSYKKAITLGDCYHITNDEIVKIKTIKSNNQE
jgi:hypothetical protein